jgi:hypothetical protein
MITIFNGWEPESPANVQRDERVPNGPSAGYAEALAEGFTRRFGARIIGIDPGNRVVIELPQINHDLKFEVLVSELGIRRRRVVYRADPL